jgi:hypothetical protein
VGSKKEKKKLISLGAPNYNASPTLLKPRINRRERLLRVSTFFSLRKRGEIDTEYGESFRLVELNLNRTETIQH